MRWAYLVILLVAVDSRGRAGTRDSPANAPSLPEASPHSDQPVFNKSAEVQNLLGLLDAFLQTHAADNPAWRREVHLAGASPGEQPAEGFQAGQSKLAGTFYFRPSSATELSVEQRRDVFRDRRFLEYLRETRSIQDGHDVSPDFSTRHAPSALPPARDYVPLSRADVLARLQSAHLPAAAIYFTISPESLTRPDRIVVSFPVEPGP